MKTDLYTKATLTVIAVCLVWICCNGLTETVSAQADRARPTPVVLVDERGLPLITPQGLRVNIGGEAVPVVIGNRTLPVVLTAVEKRGVWEPVLVDIVKQPPTPMPTP